MSSKQRPGETEADFCRRMGWWPGTRLAGDEGYGVTVIEITAVGKDRILAQSISHDGEPTRSWEMTWALDCRDWQALNVAPAPGRRGG